MNDNKIVSVMMTPEEHYFKVAVTRYVPSRGQSRGIYYKCPYSSLDKVIRLASLALKLNELVVMHMLEVRCNQLNRGY